MAAAAGAVGITLIVLAGIKFGVAADPCYIRKLRAKATRPQASVALRKIVARKMEERSTIPEAVIEEYKQSGALSEVALEELEPEDRRWVEQTLSAQPGVAQLEAAVIGSVAALFATVDRWLTLATGVLLSLAGVAIAVQERRLGMHGRPEQT